MEVSIAMGWSRILAVLAVVAVLILAYAWIDAGREPVREISVPLAVPEYNG